VAAAGEDELGIQRLIQQIIGGLGEQLGDVSNLASGDVMDIPTSVSDQIRNVYNQQAASSRQQLDQDFKSAQQDTGDYLAKRGFQDTSYEAGLHSRLGAQRNRSRADIEATRSGGISQAHLQLPFQIGQMQLDTQNSLFGGLQGFTGQLLNQFLQRSARSTTGSSTGTGSQETSGFTIGELAGFVPNVGSIGGQHG